MDLPHQVSRMLPQSSFANITLSVPVGAISVISLWLGMPTRLAREPSSSNVDEKRWTKVRSLDYMGVFALIGASVILTAALQEGAQGLSFSSPVVLTLLILVPILLFVFISWQWFLTIRSQKFNISPILSWNVLSNRVFLGVLL